MAIGLLVIEHNLGNGREARREVFDNVANLTGTNSLTAFVDRMFGGAARGVQGVLMRKAYWEAINRWAADASPGDWLVFDDVATIVALTESSHGSNVTTTTKVDVKSVPR